MLAPENLLDTLCQRLPLLTRKTELSSKIEQGTLANAIGYPIVLNQAVAVVATAVFGGPGFDAANEHGDTLTILAVCRQ